ncbi:MAG: transcriptional regulator [Flavobacteriaceae bacterium]|nr:transcriptional regulator [Flavobacteriaceae bacterium]OUX39382.1 MAG: transcriptional regulator [Flavobacteriaceae bacterium TMED265]
MVLKNNLKAVRCQKGLTQEELADLVGVSRQTIISIERYKYKPSLELGLKLSLTLDIKIEGLFYFEKK